MTKEEARIIFKSWQDYQEIGDRFLSFMLRVPESFLPYPADTLEEALNIIAKDYFDSGDKETSPCTFLPSLMRRGLSKMRTQ